MKHNHWGFTPQQLEDSHLNLVMDIEYMRKRLYGTFYEELEATVCSIMAAGVPLSNMRISSPKVLINENVMKLQGHIKFYP